MIRKGIYIIFFFIAGSLFCFSQTKNELEEQRKKALEDINYTDKLLSSTVKQKSESLNDLKILGNKVLLREKVISGLGSEIGLLNERIGLNRIAIEMMEQDLKLLKDDYSNAIVNAYKSKKVNKDFIYVLSARDFNQGYKRLKYLRQIARFRRSESDIIRDLMIQIESSKQKLESDLGNITDLKSKEEQQKGLLQSEQQRKQKLVKTLSSKEKQLQKDLAEKKRIAQKIEKEIARVIEEERKKSIKGELTPEQKIISENFSENKGRLPWPVEKGVITSRFGVHQHPVLKYVTEENYGIEITSSGKVEARAVFKGTVTAISPISGANMTIIIRHGKYYSVYSNIINVRVKKGDNVDIKQTLGEVYMETGSTNNCILKFMIFDEKYLDPEIWLTKI